MSLIVGYGDSCFVSRLAKYFDLSTADRLLLKTLEDTQEHYEAGDQIVTYGKDVTHLYLVKEGWVKCHTAFNNGEQCVTDVKLPGDMLGLFSLTARSALMSMTAIDAVELCPFPIDRLQTLFAESPRLAMIFFSIMSRENSFMLERVRGVGKIEAVQQVAYFILLIALRVGGIRRIEENRFYWPIDQRTFGDLLGLSSVHINRCLIELKNKKMIEYSRNSMKIVDVEQLEALCEFNKHIKVIDYSPHNSVPAASDPPRIV